MKVFKLNTFRASGALRPLSQEAIQLHLRIHRTRLSTLVHSVNGLEYKQGSRLARSCPRRPSAPACLLPQMGPALGPTAAPSSTASRSRPPVRGPRRPAEVPRPPNRGGEGARSAPPCLTHLGGACGPSGGERRGARPARRRLGSGASPAHTRRSPRRPRPEADAEPGNCRGGEPTFAPTARTRPPLPAEVTPAAAAAGWRRRRREWRCCLSAGGVPGRRAWKAGPGSVGSWPGVHSSGRGVAGRDDLAK